MLLDCCMNKPVSLADLVPYRPIVAKKLTEEERRKFCEEVDREMRRLGVYEANEITARSEILTAEDYNIRINY